jgi:hypothetical protein
MRRRISGSAEQAVHTPWRKRYIWTQRTGACARIKRWTRRRERRAGKDEIRHTGEDA